LHEFFPQGEVLAETAISTTDGVKVTDAARLSPGRTQELDAGPCLLHAPEICIEVLSPSNGQLEMAEKRALYFEAGAAEVWLCGLDGSMTFHLRPTWSRATNQPSARIFLRRSEVSFEF
jgi:Uma2 family endonuclease